MTALGLFSRQHARVRGLVVRQDTPFGLKNEQGYLTRYPIFHPITVEAQISKFSTLQACCRTDLQSRQSPTSTVICFDSVPEYPAYCCLYALGHPVLDNQIAVHYYERRLISAFTNYPSFI